MQFDFCERASCHTRSAPFLDNIYSLCLKAAAAAATQLQASAFAFSLIYYRYSCNCDRRIGPGKGHPRHGQPGTRDGTGRRCKWGWYVLSRNCVLLPCQPGAHNWASARLTHVKLALYLAYAHWEIKSLTHTLALGDSGGGGGGDAGGGAAGGMFFFRNG